jgi:glycosyltransferase involved in cell wall biosynthesis
VQIDHITFSKTGGAGVVAQTIAKAQAGLGHDIKFLTVVDSDLRSQPFSEPSITLAAAADTWLAASHSEKTLFSPLRGNLDTLGTKGIRPDSIIHFHWMTGVLNHEALRNLLDAGRKVVWTLHDMNPFTGGCHHSHDCTEFLRGCSNCPQARPFFQKLVSINLSKKHLDKHYPNLRIVSPTSWLSKQAKLSSVFRDQDCSVISNPIDVAFFTERNTLDPRDRLAIGASDFVSIVIAKDLKDLNKNLGFILKALERASGAVDRPLTLLLVGKNGLSFNSPLVNVRWVGELTASQIVDVADAADCVLSASIAESAGMTIVECAAMGLPSIALENGGSASLIKNGETGFLAKDFDSFVQIFVSLVQDNQLLATLGRAAKAIAAPHKSDQIAKRYIDLYKSMS